MARIGQHVECGSETFKREGWHLGLQVERAYSQLPPDGGRPMADPRRRITFITAGDRLKNHRTVGGGTGHGSDLVHAPSEGNHAVIAHGAPGRTQRTDTTEGGWHDERPTGLCAKR